MTQPLCPVKNEWHEHKKPFHDVYKILKHISPNEGLVLMHKTALWWAFYHQNNKRHHEKKKKKKKNIVEHNLSFAVK